ncbi:sigma 54-interacting transcriptional regulator [Nannocystis pusilla]|uniref:sigma 54-interacting transcriptional regulator n=1 Tax=Nannocystis pusilla TaxID=889268 RepID=UPI003B809E9D
MHPRGLGEPQALAETPVVLGRQRDAGQLVAAHKTVSRQHAEFRWDPVAGCHTVADLGSRNGTWVDGRSVHALPVYLEDQAVLRFGDVLAVYERRDADLRDAPQVSTEAVPGESLAARKLRLAIGRAGPDLAPALILGETGVGKERIAGELHRLSGRRGPLVAVNCAALSPQLVESQLFGHTRGAFTGATTEQPGMFRAATGGTLFLDELGELPLDLQPKLLRAVELGEVVAVGSTQSHRVDVRLIAATNRSLAADVEQGKFRRDLYARLALWEVHAPPLRAAGPTCSRGSTASIAPGTPRAAAASRRCSSCRWPSPRRCCCSRGPTTCAACSASSTPSAPPTARSRPTPGPRASCPWGRSPAAAPAPAAAPVEASPARTIPRAPRPRPSREALLATLEANAWSIRATAKHYDCERKQITRWLGMYAIALPGRDPEA